MTTLEQLGARRDPPPGVAILDTLLIDEAHDLVSALFAYFGESDERLAARIAVVGREVAYVEREMILNRVEQRSRGTGVGSSAGAFLPGLSTSYRVLRLRCPVSDCPLNPIRALSFDPEYPPRCPKHTDELLEREQ